VRGVLRGRLQRPDDHLLDLLVGDRPGSPQTRLIEHSLKPPLGKSRAPLARRRVIDPQTLGDLVFFRPSAANSTIRARNASV
jgi:hypothetical protein